MKLLLTELQVSGFRFPATPASVARDACRDAKDLYLLGLSQPAHAEFLVTGDKDLLACVRYGTTEVVTPRQFWENSRQK